MQWCRHDRGCLRVAERPCHQAIFVNTPPGPSHRRTRNRSRSATPLGMRAQRRGLVSLASSMGPGCCHGPVAEKPSEWSHDAGRRHLARVRWSRRVLDKPSNSRKTIIRCHWFAAWQIEHIQRAAVPSDTCMLKVILARLSATSPPRRQIDLICAPRSGGAKYPATRTEQRIFCVGGHVGGADPVKR